MQHGGAADANWISQKCTDHPKQGMPVSYSKKTLLTVLSFWL